jgi:hypothetical protein
MPVLVEIPPPVFEPGKGMNPECPSLAVLDKQLAGQKKPDWQLHLDWSLQDQGSIEQEVGYDFYVIDKNYKTNIYADCVYPTGLSKVGRACAMEFAVHYAKTKTIAGDSVSALIGIGTQEHNPGAVQSLRAAGVNQIAAYLRTK